MQLAGDYDEFGYLYGGGGGGGGPSLADVRKAAQKKKVARLLEVAETSLKPLFDLYFAISDDVSVLWEWDGAGATLLFLDPGKSTKKNGLRFGFQLERMLNHLGMTAANDEATLRTALSAQVAVDTVDWDPGTRYETGSFKDEAGIDRVAYFIAQRRGKIIHPG